MSCACQHFGFPADLVTVDEKFSLSTIFTEVGNYAALVISRDGFLPVSAWTVPSMFYVGMGSPSYRLRGGVAVTDQTVLYY